MVHMLQVTLQMTIALITWHQTTSALLQGYRCEVYTEALKFLNMESLDQRREKLNLNFAKKCLKIDNMKTLFPLCSKSHNMKTREILKFKESKAKTERYKSSSVIYMQKILNKDFQRKLLSCKKSLSCNKGTVHK